MTTFERVRKILVDQLGDISEDDADVRTVVVTAREDLEIARQVRDVL